MVSLPAFLSFLEQALLTADSQAFYFQLRTHTAQVFFYVN